MISYHLFRPNLFVPRSNRPMIRLICLVKDLHYLEYVQLRVLAEPRKLCQSLHRSIQSKMALDQVLAVISEAER